MSRRIIEINITNIINNRVPVVNPELSLKSLGLGLEQIESSSINPEQIDSNIYFPDQLPLYLMSFSISSGTLWTFFNLNESKSDSTMPVSSNN